MITAIWIGAALYVIAMVWVGWELHKAPNERDL